MRLNSLFLVLVTGLFKRPGESHDSVPEVEGRPAGANPSGPAVSDMGGDEWAQSLPCLFHEIRNYSSTLRGNIQLLRRQSPSLPMLEALDRMERTTAKFECLARDILETASVAQVTRIQRVDLESLIQGCIQDHFPESRESISIVAGTAMPAIEGEHLKLERVFLNLFRNALEAGARSILVRMTAFPERLEITVEDDGQGCSREQLANVFRPLFTTKKERGGTGLGLYIVRSILQSHGGSIRAVSKNLRPGSGTGMIFRLEIKRPEEGLGLEASKSAPFEYFPKKHKQFEVMEEEALNMD